MTRRTQRVLIDGHLSAHANVGSGVPQGTVLGPLLFLLYINDLPLMVSPGTRIRLFADDCLIYRPIRSAEDHIILQKDLNSVSRWAVEWGMAFNTSKCNVLSMNSSSHLFYSMSNDILQEVDHATYLGISFSKDLTWSNHINQVSKKAYQRLGFVRRNLKGAPKRSKSTAYTSLIRPAMEYASPIWDPYLQKDISTLERVQRKAARWVKGDYTQQSSVTAMLKDLQWESLAARRKSAKLCMFHKIHNSEIELDFERDFNVSYSTRTTRACSSISSEGIISSHKLHRLQANKRQYQNSCIIIFSTVPAWNKLQVKQINLPYKQFKSQLVFKQ